MRGSSNVDPLANDELVEEAGCAAGNVDIVDEGIDYDFLREKVHQCRGEDEGVLGEELKEMDILRWTFAIGAQQPRAVRAP